MGIKKIDFSIKEEPKKETASGNISIRVPKWLELAFYKIPKEPRNAFMRKMIEMFVKENAS